MSSRSRGPCSDYGYAVYCGVHTVLVTPTFQRKAEAAGLTDDQVLEICTWLSANPNAGALMAGTGGARKVRFGRAGKGKSGGYRTIHYFGGDDMPLFLLTLIDKSEAGNLTKAERNALAKLLPQIAEAYRAGVTRRAVQERRRKQ